MLVCSVSEGHLPPPTPLFTHVTGADSDQERKRQSIYIYIQSNILLQVQSQIIKVKAKLSHYLLYMYSALYLLSGILLFFIFK